MRGRDGERGQASTEYVAVVAVVGLLIVAGIAVATGVAPGIVNATVAQFRRALCVVTGAACTPVAPPPCVVSSRSDRRQYALSVSLVRLDDDRLLLRERLSDGTVRLTLSGSGAVGLHGGIGAELGLSVGGRQISFGTQADATISALLGDGKVFHARDDEEADRIQAKLGSGVLPGVVDHAIKAVRGLFGGGDHAPRPDETFTEGGVRMSASGHAGRGVQGGLDALATTVVGVRHDRQTGARTLYLSARRSLSALVSAVVGGRADLAATGMLALKLDGHGHPQQLSLQAAGDVGAGTALPTSLAGLLALGTPQGAGLVPTRGSGRRWEVDARLDLTDPQVVGAWAAFRHDPVSPSAIGALAAALRDRAATDVRSYATKSRRSGAGGEVDLGPGIGAQADSIHLQTRLLSASTRPAGGVWERRADCLSSS